MAQTRVKHQSIREQVRDLILHRIATGEFPPGHRIVEARIAEEVGVSPIPVREAIRELTALGMLECAPHKGARVREVSLEETIYALEVRVALETLTAKTAVPLPPDKLEDLEEAFEGILETAAQRDFVGFLEHNQVFHRTLVEASGNTVALRLWETLAFDVRTKFILEYLRTIDPVLIAEEHRAVVEAVRRGDCEATSAALATHSNSLIAYLRAESERRQREEAGESDND
ncbi:MAG: GntR family transcriptional regulator [Planctomycetota bacterium]|nr:MAG: GntR family transcriptional regulator [Planctomycetota bacterium]